jgi:hypothetical protein
LLVNRRRCILLGLLVGWCFRCSRFAQIQGGDLLFRKAEIG